MASSTTTPAGDSSNTESFSKTNRDHVTPALPPLATSADVDASTANELAASQQLTRTPTSSTSSPTARFRSASIKLLHADAPLGMWAATGSTLSKAPSLSDIRRGTFHHEDGWNHELLVEHHRRRASTASSTSGGRLSRQTSSFISGKRGLKREDTNLSSQGDAPIASVEEEDGHPDNKTLSKGNNKVVEEQTRVIASETLVQAPSTGYTPPPKLPWTTSTKIALFSFWKWFLTPLGFCITIYGLNVVAWGGMLFLLLCNAAPAMCHPTCNDINSPRRVWIEIDSQILNGLFCVTGFGLIPWRFRDLYWLLVYRGIFARERESRIRGIRMLAGIHRGWFRLPGSDKWQTEGNTTDDEHDPTLPLPLEKRLSPPLTGVRAPPTATWRMDFVIWMNVWNTFLQACLCGFMWGMNRYNRPSWSTGFFVAIACIAAGLGGIMMAIEGKKVKKVEGVAPKGVAPVVDAETHVMSDNKLQAERKAIVNGAFEA